VSFVRTPDNNFKPRCNGQLESVRLPLQTYIDNRAAMASSRAYDFLCKGPHCASLVLVCFAFVIWSNVEPFLWYKSLDEMYDTCDANLIRIFPRGEHDAGIDYNNDGFIGEKKTCP
jgi:hypothetical protein